MRVKLSKFTKTTPQNSNWGDMRPPGAPVLDLPLGMTPVQTKGERWKNRTAQTFVLGIGLYIAQAV